MLKIVNIIYRYNRHNNYLKSQIHHTSVQFNIIKSQNLKNGRTRTGKLLSLNITIHDTTGKHKHCSGA